MIKIFVFFSALFFICSCNSEESSDSQNITSRNFEQNISKGKTTSVDKGVGEITEIVLNDIDPNLAKLGEEQFVAKCSACHKIDKRFIGPALRGVTQRRSPEWIMNMILDPEKMVSENPTAKQLLAEYLSPMANQNLTKDEARSILEFFRTQTND